MVMAIYDNRVCRTCSTVFSGGPRAWYCPLCRRERKLVHDREYKRKGPNRPLGTTDMCLSCGKPYVVSNGNQKYCPTCQPKASAAIDRQQSLDYYKSNRNIINPVRNTRRLKATACVVCGKIFPAAGTCRNTCSDVCQKEKRRRIQAKADAKRRP